MRREPATIATKWRWTDALYWCAVPFRFGRLDMVLTPRARIPRGILTSLIDHGTRMRQPWRQFIPHPQGRLPPLRSVFLRPTQRARKLRQSM